MMEIKKYTLKSTISDDVGHIIDVPQAGGCLCLGVSDEFISYKGISEEVGLPINNTEEIIALLFEGIEQGAPDVSYKVIGTYEES